MESFIPVLKVINYRVQEFLFKYNNTSDELSSLLSKNILIKKAGGIIIREKTDKMFIGSVTKKDFAIIESSAKGVLCKIEGNFYSKGKNETAIKIKTNLQKAFIWLFIIWATLVAIGFLFIDFSEATISHILSTLFSLIFLICLARLILHIAYTSARKKALTKLDALFASI